MNVLFAFFSFTANLEIRSFWLDDLPWTTYVSSLMDDFIDIQIHLLLI